MEGVMCSSERQQLSRLMLSSKFVVGLLILAIWFGIPVHAQDKNADIAQKLQGFDEFMGKVLKDGNAPGIGVGIVVDNNSYSRRAMAIATMRRSCPSRRIHCFPSRRTPSSLLRSQPDFWLRKG